MPKVKLWDDLTPAEKVERWEGVERVMKKLTPHQRKKHFDMGTWGEETGCGTVACVAGHCGLDPSFRRQGFRMRVVGYGSRWEIYNPSEFFGMAGYDNIFTNRRVRTYENARAAISEYLEDLRADAKRS